MPGFLVTAGSILVALALLLWREGSAWALIIAWLLGTWGGMMVAWGLIAGWYKSLGACVVGSVFAAAALFVALRYVPPYAWNVAIACAIVSGLALVVGVWQVRYLLRRRSE